jgi:hypothetical protein
MGPTRAAPRAAWIVVAVLVGVLGAQAWPDHHDSRGLQSQIGDAR